MKKKRYQLSSAEMTIMEILWSGQRPLGSAEILEAAQDQDGNLPFSKSGFHMVINDLIDKDYILCVSGTGKGRSNGRRFAATISKSEYYALQISTSTGFSPKDIPDIVCSLVKFSENVDTAELLKRIENLVNKGDKKD